MVPACSLRGFKLSIGVAPRRQMVLCKNWSLAPFLAPSLVQPYSSHVRPSHRCARNRSVHLARPSSSKLPLLQPPRRQTFTTLPSATNDTIFALATGAGRAGVAIIRVSGPLASHIYFALCLTSSLQPYSRLPASHKLVLRNLHHPVTAELLDSGAGVIHFPAGSSYTGEESLELHVHGGTATVADILDALGSFQCGTGRAARARMAEPGEFTRRAFEHGRMDLTSAEALHGLIEAETAVQRRVALQGARGLQTQRYEAIREVLLKSMAMVEALIDFSDEEGVEEGTWMVARQAVDELALMLRSELGLSSTTTSDGNEVEAKGTQVRHVGEILTTGIRLAIYGPPNAGKSSLLNRLADRNAAIVSNIPGTTRDVLQVHLDLAGYKVVVYDTAGIRDDPAPPLVDHRSLDEIERIGIQRARHVVSTADLALLVLPATDAHSYTQVLRPDRYTRTDPDLVFYNKSDLLSTPLSIPPDPSRLAWQGSVHTNDNIPTLISDLAQLVATKFSLAPTETPLITQSRHRTLLRECLEHIEVFQRLSEQEQQEEAVDLVLAAEALRYAAKAVGRITGRDVKPDEILGSIFATFCIGK